MEGEYRAEIFLQGIMKNILHMSKEETRMRGSESPQGRDLALTMEDPIPTHEIIQGINIEAARNRSTRMKNISINHRKGKLLPDKCRKNIKIIRCQEGVINNLTNHQAMITKTMYLSKSFLPLKIILAEVSHLRLSNEQPMTCLPAQAVGEVSIPRRTINT
jgi:uncharacterized protein YjhX (UPF0386 family)